MGALLELCVVPGADHMVGGVKVAGIAQRGFEDSGVRQA